MPHKFVRRLEEAETLDRIADPLSKGIKRVVRPRPVRNALSGTAVGHPLHPVLTDVTIGAWAMSAVLDAFHRKKDVGAASDLLVEIGLVTYVPTALSGLNDWSDTIGAERRVGLAHALANNTALALYLASFAMRFRGNRQAGRALGWAGAGVLSVGGYLGGHLSFVQGVNVNRNAWEQGPQEWTPLLDDTELGYDEPRRVDADGLPVMLYRGGGRVFALAATCGHMGGPLEEGTVEDGCVTCPWHGSTFRLDGGDVVRGPATVPQPHFETRVRDGRIEIRVPARDGREDAEQDDRSPRAAHRAGLVGVPND